MPSEATTEATRREWHDLGFFYDRDDDAKEWRIAGSATGLLTFARLLREYASNPKNSALSEHEHFGPYMYLEIGTWSEPEITSHWIAGSLLDLLRLSLLIEERVSKATVGNNFKLREAYSPVSPYELVLEVHDDEFDPARADENCR